MRKGEERARGKGTGEERREAKCHKSVLFSFSLTASRTSLISLPAALPLTSHPATPAVFHPIFSAGRGRGTGAVFFEARGARVEGEGREEGPGGPLSSIGHSSGLRLADLKEEDEG